VDRIERGISSVSYPCVGGWVGKSPPGASRREVATGVEAMSNSKKSREEAMRRMKQRLQPRERQRERSGPSDTSFVQPDIHREIRYITQLAQAQDSRIVTVGKLLLFSTRTGDAWLLDPEINLAICVCRDGEPQPFRILDTPDSFTIEWTASYKIEGAAFIVEEQSGKVVVIHGYPTDGIDAACRR
jgi:hypothetical protein